MAKKPSFEDLLINIPLPVPDGLELDLTQVQLEEIGEKTTTFKYNNVLYRIPTWFARRLAILALREGSKKVRVFRPIKGVRNGRILKTYSYEVLK